MTVGMAAVMTTDMSLDKSADITTAQPKRLLAQIFAAQADAPSRGLQVYRANAHASALRALGAVYPVLAQLVGAENFAYLARDFWHANPPVRGDLAQWGGALAQFIDTAAQLADTPYLGDVARIEWALHSCAGAADVAQDAPSFTLLTEHPPEALFFVLAPGISLLHSQYPAAAITLAHLGSDGHTLDAAAALLHAGVGQSALVWRQGFTPRLQVLTQAQTSFVQALCQGASLASALDAAHPDFDFSAWLGASVQSAVVLGILVI
jgi:Putative DNA-binding domain